MNDKYFIIDFGSTFVEIECIENLALISLKNNPKKKAIIEQIHKITEMGMEGEISLRESLIKRIDLIKANKHHVEEFIKVLKSKISKSILKNKAFFSKHKDQIYIVTGAFKELIVPLTRDFGIPDDHTIANTLIYNESGYITGIDLSNPFSYRFGKAIATAGLRLTGKIYIIGDNYTDYEVKNNGVADYFIAYVENITRKTIIKHADYIAKNFNDVIEFINKT